MYKDELKKIEYYKQLLMNTLAQSGIYPSPSAIQDRLDDIDAKLSIYRYYLISVGDTFSVEDYDNDLTEIWQDLYILYQCVYELAVQEYQELKGEIDRQLQDLEVLARKYYQQGLMETTNTFGKTIFFTSSGFDQEYNNGQITIPIGNVTTHESASLACIIEATDLDLSNVYFQINGTQVSAYGYNQDLYTVPGIPDTRTYSYTVNETKKAYTFGFLIDDFTPSQNNAYTVLAGKDKVTFNVQNAVTYYDKTANAPLITESAGTLTFYVYHAKQISFEYSKEPIEQNFTGYTIDNPDSIQKIALKLEANTVVNFKTDGDIYAEQIAPYISNDMLYCYRKEGIQDYLLQETYEADEVTLYDINVIITNAEQQYYDITNIAIKESQQVIL